VANQTEQIRSHAGPSLLALAIVHALLVAASILAGTLLRHGAAVVNPYSAAEEARRFFANNPVAVRASTFFLFGSSVPLGIYAATMVSRLRFLGVRAAGSYIALFGGFAASTALAVSALSSVGAGSLSIARGNPGAAFHDFAVRRGGLRRGLRAFNGGRVCDGSFLPSASALAALVWHSHRSCWRTCLV
jgi:hypothetical protein